jgi:hypothetical protein
MKIHQCQITCACTLSMLFESRQAVFDKYTLANAARTGIDE